MIKEAIAPPQAQARRDLAEQFRIMMELGAWKHVELILNRIEEQATQEEDNLPLDELSMIRIAECRGKRKAIDKAFKDFDYIINGLK